MGEVIKAYKGFNKDMTCRGFQYEEGKEYEEERAKACNCGFHACEYPLDCLEYYDPAHSVYHEVEQSGEISKRSDDTKVASTKIKIGARVSIAGLVQAAIEYTKERATESEDAHNTGYRGASSNTGDYGASSNTGNCGASSNTGYRGKAEANHPNSMAAAWGPESMARGVKGATLVFAEWKSNGGYYWEEKTWEFVESLMVRVDGEKVKENTWYTLKNGELVEVEDE